MLEWKQILNFMICFMLFVFFEMLSQLFFFNSNDNILNLWKTNEQTKVFRTLKKKKQKKNNAKYCQYQFFISNGKVKIRMYLKVQKYNSFHTIIAFFMYSVSVPYSCIFSLKSDILYKYAYAFPTYSSLHIFLISFQIH